MASPDQPESPVGYTDDWTEEELRAVADETLRRLDEVDPYDWPNQEGDANVAL